MQNGPSKIYADKKSNSGVQDFGSLSRNALYAPLTSYVSQESNRQKEKKQQNLNNSVKEKSLYTFLEKVSVEYHNSTSNLSKLSGTNGGLPLRSRHMEAKVAQRALTLIGNGCDVQIAKSTSNLSIRDTENSHTMQRKRKVCSNFIHGSLSRRKRKRSIGHNETMENQIETKDCTFTKQMLIGLNSIWKDYIAILMKQNKLHNARESIDRSKISNLLSNAELIGAEVFIKGESSSSNNFIQAGVLIDESEKTWKIASPKNGSTKIYDSFSVGDDTKYQIHVIPKAGRLLLFQVKLTLMNKNFFLHVSKALLKSVK